jgi:hypothetical protein
MFYFLVAICIYNFPLTTACSDSQDDQWMRSITKTRWVSPDDAKPLSYRQWKANHPDMPAVIKSSQKWNGADSTEVLILVNQNLCDILWRSLDQYVADLSAEGYAVELMSYSGGNPEDVRSVLAGRSNLEGAVLVGDLPVPWFQESYFGPDDYEEFPIDLYYMDLDGQWLDWFHWDPELEILVPGADGILDTHLGNVQPEIWVGRLTASPLYTIERKDYGSNRGP